MIDSHCHLDQEPLVNNISDVIKRSKKAGITKLLTISTSMEGFKNVLTIVSLNNIVYGTFGIHPHETDTNNVTKDQIIENINKSPKIIGVGETGLDFYYNNSKKINQIKSCKEHIEDAIEISK